MRVSGIERLDRAPTTRKRTSSHLRRPVGDHDKGMPVAGKLAANISFWSAEYLSISLAKDILASSTCCPEFVGIRRGFGKDAGHRW